MVKRTKSETVKFRLTTDKKKRLDDYCTRTNISKQDLFEEFVDEILEIKVEK